MKWENYIALSLATVAVSASIKQGTKPPDWPQLSKMFDILEKVAPNVKPAKVLNAMPQLRSNATRKLIRFGPYTLPAGKGVPPGGHDHGSPTSMPTSISDMTLSQVLASLGGQITGMGLPQVTVRQLLQSMGYAFFGKYEEAMKSMINATMDPNGLSVVSTYKANEICDDCSIIAAKTDLVYEDGKRADPSTGVYLHHLGNMNLGEKPVSAWINICSSNQTTLFGVDITSFLPDTVISPFQPISMATVDEYTQWFTTKDGEFPSGHYVDPSDRFFIQAEALNYLQVPQQIYIQVDLEYVPGKVEKHATWTPLSVTGCSPDVGFVGRGKSGTITSNPFDIRVDGTVVAARGHMHDGGKDIKILLNDKPVCTSEAIYGAKMTTGDGKDWKTISRMTDCERPFTVKKGDNIKLVVNYDESAHPARESHGQEQEEMGMVFFTFVPS